MTGQNGSPPIDEAMVAPGSGGRRGSGGIDDIRRLRLAARRDRQTWPFAVAALGLVIVLAAPFYVLAPFDHDSAADLPPHALGPLAEIGAPFTALGGWAGLYWVVALVAVGLLVALHRRRVAVRRGIAGPLRPVVVVGLVLLVVLLAATPRLLLLVDPTPTASLSAVALPAVATLSVRGLTPLLLVALVLVVLSWTERSPALAGITVAFLGLALLANLYDLENLLYDAGMPELGRFGLLPNLLLPGFFLLGSGGVALGRPRARR